MERRIRLIIQGEDNASRVLSGAARNANASMSSIERAGRNLLTGWLAFKAVGAVFDVAQKGIQLIGDAFADTAQKGMEFNRTMSSIGAISQASGAQLEALRATAMRLGRDTVFTSNEAADAIKELAKAGVDTEIIVNGAADAAIALASAGELELAPAAEIMARAINGFNLGGEQAAMVADVLTGAANSSATSVENIGAAMKFASANMQALTSDTYTSEQAFVDMATAIAAASNMGIDASMAGTGIARIIEGLTPNSEKAKEMMEELGLITKEAGNRFFDAQGDFIGLHDALVLLHSSMEGLTQEEQATKIEKIFGVRGKNAVQALMNAVFAGDKTWEDYEAEVTVAGIATDTARQKLDNLAGSVEFLRGSTEFLQVTIWTDQLERQFMPAIDRLAGAFNAFGARAGLPDFQLAMQNIAAAIASVVTSGIDILQPKIEAFMNMLAKPETATATKVLASAIRDFMQAIVGEQDTNFDDNVGTKYVSYMSSGAPDTAAKNTNTVATAILGLAAAVRNLSAAKRDYDIFMEAFNKAANADYSGLPGLQTWFEQQARDASHWNDTMIDKVGNWIDNVFTPMVTESLAGAGAAFVLSATEMWNSVSQATMTSLEALGLIVTNFDLGVYMLGWGIKILNGWNAAVSVMWGAITNWGVDLASAIMGIDLSAAAAVVGRSIISGITGAIAGGIVGVVGVVSAVANAGIAAWKAVTKTRSPSRVYYELGRQAVEGLVKGFEDMSPEAVKRVEDLAGMLRDVFGSIDTGVSSLTKLAGYGQGPLRDVVVRFANDMFGVVETIQAVTRKFSADGVKAAALWAESASTVLGMVSSGIDALVKLKDYKPGLMRDAVLLFAYDAFGVVETIQAVVANFSPDGVLAAATWADSAGKVLGIIGGGIDALVKLKDYKGGLMRQTVKRFKDDVWIVVEALEDLSYKFTDEGVAWAATFADGAGRILAPISGAIEAFTKLRDYQGIMPWQVDMLGADIRLTVDKMVDMARKWSVEGVAAAAVFGDAVGRIIAPISDAIETFTKLNDYKGVAPAAVKLIADDIMGTVGHLIALSKTADQEGAQSAALFADASTRIFSGVKAGLDTISAINDTKGLDAGKAAQVFADITNIMNSAIALSKTEGDLGGVSFIGSWQNAMLGMQGEFNLFMQSYFDDAYTQLTSQALDAGHNISGSFIQGFMDKRGEFYSAGLANGQAYAQGVADGSGGAGGGGSEFTAMSRGGGGGRNNSVTINLNGLSTAEATERVRIAAQRSSNFRTSVATVYGTGA